MEMHFATLWESVADAIGDCEASVDGASRRTWSEYDQRASRLAAAFAESGLGPDSKVGLYLWNSNEYLESHFAAMKGRGVPVNINYRYLDDELHYLLDNSDAEALVFHTSLGDRVARVMERAPGVKLWVEVDDGGESLPGAVSYEELIAACDPAPRINRSPDDVYMLYTGGTTGMPKGVMYDMAGITQAFIQIGFPIFGLGLPAIDEIPALVEMLVKEQGGITSIPACPLMHGTGMWLGAMIPHCAGARVVLLSQRSFDARELWEVTERERATQLVIVGDAFATPMLRVLDEAKAAGQPHDVSSVKMIVSSGVMWTTEIKAALLDWHDWVLIDAMGSTEGAMGSQVTTRGNLGQTAKFAMNPTTKVFGADGREVEPGSGEAGMVAASGNVPIGYYKDEAKSAAAFRTVDGMRYSFPGDWAIVEADGSLTLLGRGSNCINTAGEKVYPEEVEEAVKQHPGVIDCLVVGVDDEKFGQRVTGVVSLRSGSDADAEALREFTRSKLAGYKLPKQLVVVDEVQRAPNGKPDYKWARKRVEEALGIATR
jgi:fatty-acyl-CoA synthase